MYASTSPSSIAGHVGPADCASARESAPKSGPRAISQPFEQPRRAPAILLELLDALVISWPQLDEVMAAQKRDGRRITTILVDAGLATEAQLTQVLCQQRSAPWVSLRHVHFSRELLNLVSYELAEKFCLIPLFLRRVRRREVLYVAIDDPSDEMAQQEVAECAGLPVRAMIAPATAIRSAIRAYYGASGGSL